MSEHQNTGNSENTAHVLSGKDKTKINQLGGYLLFFLMVLTWIPIITYFSKLEDPLIRTLVYIGCSGGIGGMIYCIRGFYTHVNKNNFNLNYTWWYICRPFISVVAGVFAYFLIMGGLLSIGSISEINNSRTVMLFCAVAFLAGFSFNEFVDKIYELSSTLFSKEKKDVNQKP